jgi:transcription antitermination protein NusB
MTTGRVVRTTPRRRAREFVLQGLYQRQLSGNSAAAIRAQIAEAAGFAKADQAYFDALWMGASAGFDALVARCAPYLDRRAAELSPIERAILAIGAWELEHRLEIPYRVAINEAVELAKSYGGTDGHKFVNGVLDKLAAEVRGAEIAALAEGRRSGAVDAA